MNPLSIGSPIEASAITRNIAAYTGTTFAMPP